MPRVNSCPMCSNQLTHGNTYEIRCEKNVPFIVCFDCGFLIMRHTEQCLICGINGDHTKYIVGKPKQKIGQKSPRQKSCKQAKT